MNEEMIRALCNDLQSHAKNENQEATAAVAIHLLQGFLMNVSRLAGAATKAAEATATFTRLYEEAEVRLHQRG